MFAALTKETLWKQRWPSEHAKGRLSAFKLIHFFSSLIAGNRGGSKWSTLLDTANFELHRNVAERKRPKMTNCFVTVKLISIAKKKVLRLDSSRKFLWTLVRRKDTWGLSHSPVLIVPRVGLGWVASTIKSWDCNPPTHHKLFWGERANIQLLTRTEKNKTRLTQKHKPTEVRTGPFQNSTNRVKQKQTTLNLFHLREQKRSRKPKTQFGEFRLFVSKSCLLNCFFCLSANYLWAIPQIKTNPSLTIK